MRRRRIGRRMLALCVVLLAPISLSLFAVRSSPLAAGHRADVAPHDIIIQQNPATGRLGLYNRITGQPFMPVGNDYLRSDPLSHQANTFDPGIYSASTTEAAFQRMEQFGYNTARLYVWPARIGNPTGTGLDDVYLTNLTDALNRAKNHHLFPVLSVTGLPETGGYFPATLDPPGYVFDAQDANHATSNWLYLTQQALDARTHYLTDLITGLQQHGAPLASVLGYDFTAEIAYIQNRYPLEFHAGQTATKTGVYDLGSAADRDLMMDVNLVAYIDAMVDTVKAIDPYALTSVQLPPNATNPDPVTYTYRDRWPMLPPTVTDGQGRHGSRVDFITLSLYPTFDKSMDELMNSFDALPSEMTKPLVTLETGYLDYYLQGRPWLVMDDLPPRLVQWEKDACAYHVYGWYLFTWDSAHSDTTFLNAVENNELFARAVAPRTIPDVCGILQPGRPTIALPTAACAAGRPAITFTIGQAESVTRYDIYRSAYGDANAVRIGTLAPSDFQSGAYMYTDVAPDLQEGAYYTYSIAVYDENNPSVATTPALSYHSAHDTDDLRLQPYGSQYSGYKLAPACAQHPNAPGRAGPTVPAKPNPLPAVRNSTSPVGIPSPVPVRR